MSHCKRVVHALTNIFGNKYDLHIITTTITEYWRWHIDVGLIVLPWKVWENCNLINTFGGNISYQTDISQRINFNPFLNKWYYHPKHTDGTSKINLIMSNITFCYHLLLSYGTNSITITAFLNKLASSCKQTCGSTNIKTYPIT